ncbi:MAG: hypothetical protein Q8Q09_06975 [Deltaproteobacteria bacterium]|nr:hypothetical protein [Deltaproteobacteria bacterium]
MKNRASSLGCSLLIATLAQCSANPPEDVSPVDATRAERDLREDVSMSPIDAGDDLAQPDASAIDDVSIDQENSSMDVSLSDGAVSAPDGGSACASSAMCPTAPSCAQRACVSGRCVTLPNTCSVAPSQTLAAACPAGTLRFNVSLGGACGGTCRVSDGTCIFTAQSSPCVSAMVNPASGAATSPLELFFADEALVWSWYAGLSATDFALRTPGATLTLDPSGFSDDALFQLWAQLGPPGSTLDTIMDVRGLRVPAADFTVAAINRVPGVITGYLPRFDHLANWARLNTPGNPFRDDPAVLRRAFVTAFIALVRAEGGSFGGASSAPVNNFAMITRGFWLLRGVAIAEALKTSPAGAAAVPPCVQSAYHQLLSRFFDRLVAGPLSRTESNTDMFTPIVSALYRTARVLDDEARLARAAQFARNFVDPAMGLFHRAGFWHHGYDGNAEDVSYDGIAQFFFSDAALASRDRADFDFLRTTHATLVDQRAHMSVPDPAAMGALVGPTHFCPATADPAPRDQWAYSQRMIAQAALDDDALYALVRGSVGLPNRAALQSALSNRVREINTALAGTATLQGLASTDHFHTVINHHATSDLTGVFARLQSALGTPRAQLPIERETNALRRLGDDYTWARRSTFGSMIHWGRVSSSHGSSARYPTLCNLAVNRAMPMCTSAASIGAEGFGGGALSMFWTPTAGPVLMGLGHGLQNDREQRNAWGEGLGVNNNYDGAAIATSTDAWWRWPTHALGGRVAAGRPFSTARVRDPMVVHSMGDSVITVTGTLSCAVGAVGCSSDPTAALRGTLSYQRVFENLADQVRITTSTTYTGASSPLDELVESLPIYLGGFTAGSGTAVTLRVVTTVQLESMAGTLSDATTTFATGVRAVVIRRGTGGVRVEFASPQRVRLTASVRTPSSTELWLNTYQFNAAATNLQIDLRGGATTVPASTRVSYSVRAI